jgi:trehalose-phosphatase
MEPSLRYDDPAALAERVAALDRPVLIATDVDGTLAPIAATPESAQLLPGALAALSAIRRAGHVVAVVSGRPVHDLRAHFLMPDDFHLVGSHGAEHGGALDEVAARTAHEAAVLAAVDDIVERVARTAPGSRVEHKPFAIALHVRRCEPEVGDHALSLLEAELDGAKAVTLLPGHRVLEVSVRPTSKCLAVQDLCTRTGAASVLFVGDDHSDEAVFASLGHTDLAVKVGDEATVAQHRLAAPADVVAMFARLADLLAG